MNPITHLQTMDAELKAARLKAASFPAGDNRIYVWEARAKAIAFCLRDAVAVFRELNRAEESDDEVGAVNAMCEVPTEEQLKEFDK